MKALINGCSKSFVNDQTKSLYNFKNICYLWKNSCTVEKSTFKNHTKLETKNEKNIASDGPMS